jgi:MbtH protein
VTRVYDVVANDELQHSLWPTTRDLPAGWARVHGPATEAECLTYVETVWPDITPRSVRESLSDREAGR